MPSHTPTLPYSHAQPVLTAAAMRAADRFAIEDYGLPSFTLMESAGRAAAERIEAFFGPLTGRTVAVYCGKGNNGGDGLVTARQLYARGAHVRVITTAPPDALSTDAAHNLKLLHRLTEAAEDDHLRILPFENLRQLASRRVERPALYVDALLGTGLESTLRDPLRSLVDWLNEETAPKAALDVPTGLHADTGEVLGSAFRADLTVTMAAHKAGLLLGEGPHLAGHVEVAEIGIPAFALYRAMEGHAGCALRTTDAAVLRWLPQRPPEAHKYSVGMALVVAGSPGFTGAPVLAALAAARAGAGYVACAAPASIQDVLAGKLTDVPTLALPEHEEGGLDPDAALDALAAPLEKARALLVGPGLGRSRGTQQLVRRLLRHTDRPAVIDADGLNALDASWLEQHAAGRWILTPHAGEFKRLAGADVDLTDRLRTTQAHARRWNSILLLKGIPSIAAAPNGRTYVCATGNPALASAGTGDVLAGLCTGLLAQGLPAAEAAAGALHLGGAAADRYAARRASRALLATDLLTELPAVLHERF